MLQFIVVFFIITPCYVRLFFGEKEKEKEEE